MTGSRGPAVRVRVVPSRRGLRIEFEAARWRVRPVRVTLPDPGRVAEARREPHAGLTRVEELVDAVEVADELLPEPARALGSTGRRMILVLFGNQPGTILPLFDVAGCDDDVADRAGFLRACRSFIGFSCVVRRRIQPVPVSGDSGIHPRSDGRLAVRYPQHDSLPGAGAERDWLAGAAGAGSCGSRWATWATTWSSSPHARRGRRWPCRWCSSTRAGRPGSTRAAPCRSPSCSRRTTTPLGPACSVYGNTDLEVVRKRTTRRSAVRPW